MCDKVILKNSGTLMFVPDCYKYQKMGNKAVDNYAHALDFVPDCYKTEKCAIKPSILIMHLQYNLFLKAIILKKCVLKLLIPVLLYLILSRINIRLKKKENFDKVVSKNPFMVKYCLDRYNTQEMCDKTVDSFLPTLKFVPDWFVISNIIKKLKDTTFSNDDIVL